MRLNVVLRQQALEEIALPILFQGRISGPVAPGVAGHGQKLGHGHGQISQTDRSIGSGWKQRLRWEAELHRRRFCGEVASGVD